MTLRLVQYEDASNAPCIALLDDTGPARRINGYTQVLDLAHAALKEGVALADLASRTAGDVVELDDPAQVARLRPPITHGDPAHLAMTGTGLTHLGSAEGRDKMHKAAAGQTLTDSMRMFNMGLEGGKPASGQEGAQPEWFYKGDGLGLVACGEPLRSPSFALDGGEEPEVAGLYLIDDQGRPRRLGFALANEFSDHVTERGNYLWLAHSKLRPAALGPELYLGELPKNVEGKSRIVRNGETVWEKDFLSGEANMSHSLSNLERHHFKYDQFRRPGDVHVHFFGTATLSFSDGFQTAEGDIFEIEASPFRLPLRNPLALATSASVEVEPL
jgi:hypothetical protein